MKLWNLLQFKNKNHNAVSSTFSSIPVGIVMAYAGEAQPVGWLLCNGSAISKNEYPELFALTGGQLPDLRSRFIIGAGQGQNLSHRKLYAAGGTEEHTLQLSELPEHSHGFGVGGGGARNGSGFTGVDTGYSDNYYQCAFQNQTLDAGNGDAHNNMPPFYALTYIIKY